MDRKEGIIDAKKTVKSIESHATNKWKMVKSVILSIETINWIIGMILILVSNASGIISKTNFERTGWNKNRMGYGISEIRKVIEITNDEVVKNQLRAKINRREFAYWLFISTPTLTVIGNLIK